MKRFLSLVLVALLCMAVAATATGCSHSSAVAPVTMMSVESVAGTVDGSSTDRLLTWDVQHGTLTVSDKPLLKRPGYNDWPGLQWSPLNHAVIVLQQFVNQKVENAKEKKLLMLQALSPDVSLLQLPGAIGGGNIYQLENVSWYAWDKKVFMSAPQEVLIPLHGARTLAGKNIQITQYTTPVQTLAAALPSELQSIQGVYALYGSGSLENGFVLLETHADGTTTDVLWLIRLTGGKATWLPCGDAPCGGVIAGAGPQFVRIDSRLYLLGGCRNKIAMIDTGAANPVITYPRGLNRAFSSLIAEGAKNVTGDAPFSPMLKDGGTILLLQPFAVGATYALKEDGTILGSLQQDAGGKLWCADLHGRQQSSLSLPGLQYLSFPSPDLFLGL